MSWFKRLAALDPGVRALLAEVLCVALFVRLVLTVLPFRVVERLLLKNRKRRKSRNPNATIDHIVGALARICRFVPRCTCLVQALTAHLVMAKHGHPSQLRIGVAKDAGGNFQAHAWLEHAGEIVVGRHEAGHYKALTSWETS